MNSTTTQHCPQSQSLKDWLFYLESQHPTEIDLGLARVKAVAEKAKVLDLGAKKVVLVAGTNGKGTTIRFMEQCLLQQGYSVGVFSSPHMTHYNERVRINDGPLSDEQHVDAFSYIEKMRGETSLTYFEFGTLAAYYLFQQAKLDYVLVEVGLGGRLDATNILPHDLAIVTALGLDHTDWLGDTIEKIGFEKAGIFKSGKPAVVGMATPPETVFEQAKALGVSELRVAGRDYQFSCDYKNGQWQLKTPCQTFSHLALPLIPAQNIATAVNALEYLDIKLDEQQLSKLCETVSLPGRLQILQNRPMTMVDVGHNAHAVEYLVRTLTTHPKFSHIKDIEVVFSMMADKDIEATVKTLQPIVSHWHVAPLVGNKRAATIEKLQTSFEQLAINNVSFYEDVKSAWQRNKLKIGNDVLLLGVGSFYTVAEIVACHDIEI